MIPSFRRTISSSRLTSFDLADRRVSIKSNWLVDWSQLTRLVSMRSFTFTPPSTNYHHQSADGIITWSPDTNALSASIDPLPQPYRLIDGIMRDAIIDRAWEVIQTRRAEYGTIGGRDKRTERFANTEDEEDHTHAQFVHVPKRDIEYSPQDAIRPFELTTATPARVITPNIAPNPHTTTANHSSAMQSMRGTCGASSADGRVGVIGTVDGRVFLIDLQRSYSVICSLNNPGDPSVTSVSITSRPILRGDEDLTTGDEIETSHNYVLGWSTSEGTVRVVTLNAHTWLVYEGCTIQLSHSLSSQSSSTSSSSSVCIGGSLLFSPDGSHLSVTLLSSIVLVYQLRPHRFDPALQAPKLTQKEILSNPTLAAAAAAQVTHASLVPTSNPSSLPSTFSSAVGSPNLATSSTSELTAFLAEAHDSHGHGHGMSYIEARTITTVQPKLYTGVLVLRATPPSRLVPNGPSASSPSTSTTLGSATANVPSSSSLSASQSVASSLPSKSSTVTKGMPSNSKLNRGGSLKNTPDKNSVSNSAPSATNDSAAASVACGVASVSLTFPVAPIRPTFLQFLYHARERVLNQSALTYVTRGLAVAWYGDTSWREWDLDATKPILPNDDTDVATHHAIKTRPNSSTPPTTLPTPTVPLSSTNSKKSDKLSATAAAAAAKEQAAAVAAAAAAAAVGAQSQSNTSRAVSSNPDAPSSNTFLLGAPLTCMTADDTTLLLACGLSNGSCVIYDTRLRAELSVLNPTPILSHTSTPASTSASVSSLPCSKRAITCLAFFRASHLLAGCHDRTVTTFHLPPNLTRARTVSTQRELTHCKTRISATLPGEVRHIKIGTKLPIALVTCVERPVDEIANQAVASVAASSTSAAANLVLLDFQSNFVLGKLGVGVSSDGHNATDLVPSDSHATVGGLTRPAAIGGVGDGVSRLTSPAVTGDFTVYEEKEDGRIITSPTHDGVSKGSLALPFHRSGAGTLSSSSSSSSGSVRWHPSLMNAFQTLDSEQILILSSSSSSSSSSSPAATGVLVYSLPSLLASLYPSIGACPNAFLRQQHAIGMFQHYSDHFTRRQPNAFQSYLAILEDQLAQAHQRQLHAAFKHVRHSSSASNSSTSHRRHRSGQGSDDFTRKTTHRTPMRSTGGSMTPSHNGSNNHTPRHSYGGSHGSNSLLPSLHPSTSSSGVATPSMTFAGSRSHIRTGSASGSGSVSGRRSKSRDRNSITFAEGTPHTLAPGAVIPILAPVPSHATARDTAAVIHQQLFKSATNVEERAQMAKARRVELHQLLKQQARQQQQAQRFNGQSFQMSGGFPPIAQRY